MEERDERLVAQLITKDNSLKKYVQNHQEYERKLEEFNKRIHLSTDESMERKRIQKLKLANKDKIQRILAQHRMAQGKNKAGGSRS